jgi:hypothetical protein
MARANGKRGIMLGVAGLGLYLFTLGVLGGIVYERWRFSQRRVAIVRRLEAEQRAWHARMMDLEHASR